MELPWLYHLCTWHIYGETLSVTLLGIWSVHRSLWISNTVSMYSFRLVCVDVVICILFSNLKYLCLFHVWFPGTYPCSPVPGYHGGKKWCTSSPDGQYPLTDVFKYVICTNHTDDVRHCLKGAIYSPLQKKCLTTLTSRKYFTWLLFTCFLLSVWLFFSFRNLRLNLYALTYNTISSFPMLENFCTDRKLCACNWRNPWNCHYYITCSHGYWHVRTCATSSLVYNPDLDKCQFAKDYPCTVISEYCHLMNHFNISTFSTFLWDTS